MLTWRGFYLGPHDAMHPVDGPVFAIRSGNPDERCRTAEGGIHDADSACFLARIGGIADHAVIYLDIDDGCTASYFTAWVLAVRTRGFTPGVTGSPNAVALLGVRGVDLAQWVFRAIDLDPAGQVVDEGREQWVH